MDSILKGFPMFRGYCPVPQGIRGIYICLDANDKPLYVGQSKNIRKRFGSHSRLDEIRKNGFTWLVVIPVPESEDLDSKEHEVMSALNPLLNISAVRGRVWKPMINV